MTIDIFGRKLYNDHTHDISNYYIISTLTFTANSVIPSGKEYLLNLHNAYTIYKVKQNLAFVAGVQVLVTTLNPKTKIMTQEINPDYIKIHINNTKYDIKSIVGLGLHGLDSIYFSTTNATKKDNFYIELVLKCPIDETF